MTSYHRHLMTLVDLATGLQLTHSGQVKVCAAGTYANVAVYDINGTLLTSTRPTIDFSTGKIEFQTLDTVSAVDLYIYTNKGYCTVIKNVTPGSVSDIAIDLNRLNQTLIYPFSISDTGYADATNIDTKVKFADYVQVLPWGMGVYVADAVATETISVGTEASSGEDNDGFMALVSIGTAGLVKPAVGYSVGSNAAYVDVAGGTAAHTFGLLFSPTLTAALVDGTDVDTQSSGFYLLYPHTCNGAAQEYLAYTLTAGSAAGNAEGLIILPMQLPTARL